MVTSCLVIGDATLDVTVQPAEPMRLGGDVPAGVVVGPGGQGANVAVRLARRGVATTLVAPLADDAGGRLLAEVLRAEGLRLVSLLAHRTSTVVIVLDAAGERSMLSDRCPLPAEAVAATVEGAAWIHASAYPLLDDRGGDELARVLRGRAATTRLSIAGGSIPSDQALVRRFRARLEASGPDLLAVNLDEAGALLGDAPDGPADAAAGLRGSGSLVIVTAGRGGSAAATTSELLSAAADHGDGPVLDATGAGDAYLASLLAALSPEPWPPDTDSLRIAMQRAGVAGAQAARVMGAQGRIALEDDRRGG